MTRKSQLGEEGENTACKYLIENKYKILERNFKKPWGELDIVAKDPDGTLVFIEVKTIEKAQSNYLSAEDQMTSSKISKTARMAEGYASANPKFINEKRGWRIDLIAINFLPEFSIKHYKNI